MVGRIKQGGNYYGISGFGAGHAVGSWGLADLTLVSVQTTPIIGSRVWKFSHHVFSTQEGENGESAIQVTVIWQVVQLLI